MNIRGVYSINEGEREIFITNLARIFEELRSIIFTTPLRVKPERNANGVEPIKEALRASLIEAGWANELMVSNPAYASGGTKLDFVKSLVTGVGIGVETQFGYESRIQDDYSRIQEAILQRVCNVGVLIVPVLETAQFLTDRIATFEAAVRTFEAYPNSYRDLRLVVIGIGHDSTTEDPLPKQRRKVGNPSR